MIEHAVVVVVGGVVETKQSNSTFVACLPVYPINRQTDNLINFAQSSKMKSNELLRLLKKDGWYVERPSGSHVIMKHSQKEGQLSVPQHASKEVKKGLLSAILKEAKIKTKKRWKSQKSHLRL